MAKKRDELARFMHPPRLRQHIVAAKTCPGKGALRRGPMSAT